ncbi:MAG TPA: hypothetical protein VNQ77_20065 [Frankiaceae bacterium]|nr:hypothetical protein [Frankiaceae bacterium]
MRKYSKRTTIVAASAATVMAASGIAYAWYSANVAGTGTGSATPADPTVADVTFSASSISGLLPGGAAVTTTVTPSNPNPYSVHISEHTVSVSSASGGDCDDSEASLSGSGTMVEQTIPANSTGTPFTIDVSMGDEAFSQDDCAGQALTVTYAAS